MVIWRRRQRRRLSTQLDDALLSLKVIAFICFRHLLCFPFRLSHIHPTSSLFSHSEPLDVSLLKHSQPTYHTPASSRSSRIHHCPKSKQGRNERNVYLSRTRRLFAFSFSSKAIIIYHPSTLACQKFIHARFSDDPQKGELIFHRCLPFRRRHWIWICIRTL